MFKRFASLLSSIFTSILYPFQLKALVCKIKQKYKKKSSPLEKENK